MGAIAFLVGDRVCKTKVKTYERGFLGGRSLLMGDRFLVGDRFFSPKQRNRVSVVNIKVNCESEKETRFLDSGGRSLFFPQQKKPGFCGEIINCLVVRYAGNQVYLTSA